MNGIIIVAKSTDPWKPTGDNFWYAGFMGVDAGITQKVAKELADICIFCRTDIKYIPVSWIRWTEKTGGMRYSQKILLISLNQKTPENYNYE